MHASDCNDLPMILGSQSRENPLLLPIDNQSEYDPATAETIDFSVSDFSVDVALTQESDEAK